MCPFIRCPVLAGIYVEKFDADGKRLATGSRRFTEPSKDWKQSPPQTMLGIAHLFVEAISRKTHKSLSPAITRTLPEKVRAGFSSGSAIVNNSPKVKTPLCEAVNSSETFL